MLEFLLAPLASLPFLHRAFLRSQELHAFAGVLHEASLKRLAMGFFALRLYAAVEKRSAETASAALDRSVRQATEAAESVGELIAKSQKTLGFPDFFAPPPLWTPGSLAAETAPKTLLREPPILREKNHPLRAPSLEEAFGLAEEATPSVQGDRLSATDSGRLPRGVWRAFAGEDATPSGSKNFGGASFCSGREDLAAQSASPEREESLGLCK